MMGGNLNTSLDSSEGSILNPTIIKTDVGAKDGQNKCPKCGATDITLNVKNGKLRCNYCRYEFEALKVEELDIDTGSLNSFVVSSGAQNIVEDASESITLKCESCGAEVVISKDASNQARCHWCRNILSINSQMPNGSVPDVVLPFSVSKEEAKKLIEDFVSKRKFFAHPKFKAEFKTDNIMGVYFPYMVVDINSHAFFTGSGEHLVKRYTRGSGSNSKTYYDADLYNIEREFDLEINGLTVESNKERLNKASQNQTNNIINSIMPFDIENCVKYNANYLRGYTSERRNMNIEELKHYVETESKDIARFACNETLKHYDRGVCFQKEELSVKGELWKSAYLPVWLYSYQEVKPNKKVLHYVAVNARTKETMGSVPIHMPKLLGVSFLVEIGGFLAFFFSDFEEDWLFLLLGLIYFIFMFLKYRNVNARHKHETETKKQMENLRKVDDYVTRKTGLTSASMSGANNTRVNGVNNIGLLESIPIDNDIVGFIKDNIDKN